MLGPRLGRYANGINPLPLGNPVNACMGTSNYRKGNSTNLRNFKACSCCGGAGWLSTPDQLTEFQAQSNF